MNLGNFIGEDIKLEPVILQQDTSIPKFYLTTWEKIHLTDNCLLIENLKVEKDLEEVIGL